MAKKKKARKVVYRSFRPAYKAHPLFHLVVILVLLVLLGVILYCLPVAKQTQPIDFGPSAVPMQIPLNISSMRWKTYREDPQHNIIDFSTESQQVFYLPMYGIQFSMPPVTGGHIQNYYNSDKRAVIETSKFPQCNQYGYYSQGAFLNPTYEMNVSIRIPYKQFVDPEVWFNSCEKPFTFPNRNVSTTSETINGYQAVAIKDRNRTGNSGINNYDEYIFLNRGIVYIFSFANSTYETKDEIQQTQQIINSIQFSEPKL